MVVGYKKLKVPGKENLPEKENGNLKSPCGNVIDGSVIRTATTSFDPSAKTPVCRPFTTRAKLVLADRLATVTDAELAFVQRGG